MQLFFISFKCLKMHFVRLCHFRDLHTFISSNHASFHFYEFECSYCLTSVSININDSLQQMENKSKRLDLYATPFSFF